MASISLQVRIPTDSNLPEDVVVHSWAASGTQNAEDMAVTFAARLQAFYTATTGPTTARIGTYLSGWLNLAAATIRAYDIADPEPRVPVLDSPFNIGPNVTSSSGMPNEVACCLSFYAGVESGVNAARRRGRVYLGPLNNTAASATAGSNNVPLGTFLADCNLRAKALCDASTEACFWGVWSRTDNVVRRVTGGWMDNAWDTQRRRGEKASTRYTWVAAP